MSGQNDQTHNPCKTGVTTDTGDDSGAGDTSDARGRSGVGDNPDAGDDSNTPDTADVADDSGAGDTSGAGDAPNAGDSFDTADLPDEVDSAAVERTCTVGWVLDENLPVPGTEFRIGLDPVIGLVPGVGDTISAGISAYIVLEAARLGVSSTTLVRTLANVAVDAVGGSVPYVGTVFGVVWKTNRRNLTLAADLASALPREPDSTDAVEVEID